MPEMKMNTSLLEKVAVDMKALATNIGDMPDCSGAGIDIKTEIINRFPLVTWLLNTSLTQRVRRDMNANGQCLVHKDGDGQWVIEVPREIWTTVPTSSENECCWQPMDFAKCAGSLPLNLLCLKDCDSIMDELVGRNIRFGEGINGLASASDTINEVKRRVARLSMAFYTANTAINGHHNIFTDILKPFYGVMEVLENPAVATVNGTNILQAFDSVACRLALLGGGEFVFALNPVIYQGLLSEIRPGQNGEFPAGWSRNGDELRFHGWRFIQDRLIPVDVEAGTGEIWVLNSDAAGLYLATDLMPADAYIKYSGHKEVALADGCGEDCTYYYNIGTALANNANKLMRIVDVPVSGACSTVIGDLEALVNPQTLIPTV